MQMADTDDVSYFLRYLVVHNSTIRTQITNDDTRYTNLHLMNIYLHTSKYSFRDAETSAKRNAIHIYIYIYILYFRSMVGDMCIDYFTIVLVSLNFQRCSNCILVRNYMS